MPPPLSPFRYGYLWAGNLGEHGKLSCEDAIDAYGTEFGSKECDQFLNGCRVGQNELGEGIYDGEA